MYNNQLYHAGNHKYIAKVKVGRKTRYFYSQKEYDAYLEGRKDQVNVANAEKNGTVPYQTKTRTMTEQEKRNADARREYAKKTGDYSASYGKKSEVKTVAQMRQEKAAASVDTWRKNVATVKKNQEASGDKVVNNAKKQLSSSVDTWKKNVSTVANNAKNQAVKKENESKKKKKAATKSTYKARKKTAEKGKAFIDKLLGV